MLDKAIEMMSEGYMTNSQIVEDVTRKYGLSPAEVITEKERRKEILDNLQIIMDNLTETQRKILALTGQGLTVREMEEELGIRYYHISEYRKSISKRLFKIANEDRINELEKQISAIPATKKSAKRQKLLDEYEKRISVRESLKKLFVLLMPPESTKEMKGSVNLPAYSFEREMLVGTGMRKAIHEGYHIMKTVTECHMPEYMADCFGDGCTCCMLCATCRRQKDVAGRSASKTGGLWHTDISLDGIEVDKTKGSIVIRQDIRQKAA